MPINPVFNFYKNKTEQTLVEDLITESFKLTGFECLYIPIENFDVQDFLYGDLPLKEYKNAFTIEAVLTSSTDPGMNNDFFSRFGLEIKNNVRINISRRTFQKYVPQEITVKPKEGDLIYIPFLSGTGELYEIKFNNDTTDFYTLGRKYPYFWEVELELYKYSFENIEVGIDEVDKVVTDSAYTIELNLDENSGNGDFILKEYVYQSPDGTANNAVSQGMVANWDKTNYILHLQNVKGNFTSNISIVGMQSNTSYLTLTKDLLKNPSRKDGYDNLKIENESNLSLVNDEINPFGSLGYFQE